MDQDAGIEGAWETFREAEAVKRRIANQMREQKTKQVTDDERDARSAPKPYRAPIGPTPSLGDAARQPAGWLWLYCPSCQHRVAAHLMIFANQLGNECPLDEFRAKLWCTMCGQLDCATVAPSWMGSDEATNAFPEKSGYYAHMEKLDRCGAFSWMVIDKRKQTIRRESLTAPQARAAAKRYSERGGEYIAMRAGCYRAISAQGQS